MAALDLLVPPACAGCGRYGARWCASCRASLQPASSASDRFLAADRGVVVGESLELAVAAFVYAGPLRRALSRLKYGGASQVGQLLADAAAPALQRLVELAGGGTLVPVPVHLERLRTRGYNQAALLAEALGRRLHLPVTPALVRRRQTMHQHCLDRATRLRNLRAAFAPAPDIEIPALCILVDDILTTSATLEACAAVLTGAGSKRVLGFAVAREV